MAIDAVKLKGLSPRKGLGAPPTDVMPEVVGAPLVAPASPAERVSPPQSAAPEPVPERDTPAQSERRGIVDGRRLRRTGRTLQFGTRVTEQFAVDIRTDAEAAGMLIVEVLEEAVSARRRLLALARPGETLEGVIERLSAR